MGFATKAHVLVQLMLLVSCLTSVFSEEPYPPIPSPSHQHGHPPTPSEAPAHPPSRHHHHHHHHHGHPPTYSPVHPPSHPPAHQPPHHAPPSHPPVHPPSHPPHQPPPSHPPVYPPAHPPSFVAVQGVVYCKSCKYAGVDGLLGASPIDGAVVKLQCNNSKYPVVQTAKTDKNGYFFLAAPKTITSNVVNKCKVFLVSSPLTKCNKPSNLNNGLKGAILRPEISYVADKLPFILYTVGPFAFEPICLR